MIDKDLLGRVAEYLGYLVLGDVHLLPVSDHGITQGLFGNDAGLSHAGQHQKYHGQQGGQAVDVVGEPAQVGHDLVPVDQQVEGGRDDDE